MPKLWISLHLSCAHVRMVNMEVGDLARFKEEYITKNVNFIDFRLNLFSARDVVNIIILEITPCPQGIAVYDCLISESNRYFNALLAACTIEKIQP